MDTALFIGMTHKQALKRQMDVLAHNISNMNTTSFKEEKVIFQTLLVDAPSSPGTDGGKIAYVVDKGVTRDFSAGRMVNTGNPLDVFMSDGGFLTVENAEGEVLYTRNGRMALDNEKFLVLLSGEKVYDDTGSPIQFDDDENNILISETGVISTEQGEKATLQAATFADPNALKKRGNSLYEASQDPINPDEAPAVTFTAGAIEGSNINPVKSMVEMIKISSAYSRADQSGKQMEDLQEEAIKRLGRTR